jgi:hypothetical protein
MEAGRSFVCHGITLSKARYGDIFYEHDEETSDKLQRLRRGRDYQSEIMAWPNPA